MGEWEGGGGVIIPGRSDKRREVTVGTGGEGSEDRQIISVVFGQCQSCIFDTIGFNMKAYNNIK